MGFEIVAQDQDNALEPTPCQRPEQLVVCVDNEGYGASLEKRKIYVGLPDAAADRCGFIRVIDESGESYLYPRALFRAIAFTAISQEGRSGCRLVPVGFDLTDAAIGRDRLAVFPMICG